MDTGNKGGFTLVEILVVLVIFSIMLSAIASVFISGIKIQRNAIAQEQLLDQLNYAVEYMGRSIRMAKKSTGSCIEAGTSYDPENSSATELKFLNEIDNVENCIEFSYDSGDKTIHKDATPLTSDDVKITKLLFNVSGGENEQSRVTILIEAESKSGDPLQKMEIQTTISARDLNK
jgi:prepilin-type N-terminal cleavage/methylation domain-containing protein